MQQNDNYNSGNTESSEEQQQSKIMPISASAPVGPTGSDGGSQRLRPQSYNLLMPEMRTFRNEHQTSTSTESQINNMINNQSRINGATENVTVNNDEKSNNKVNFQSSSETRNATNDLVETKSEASFGSFSMDEEDMIESDENLGELTVHTFNGTSGDVDRENTMPHHESIERVPQNDRRSNGQKRQVLLPDEENPPSLSHAPSATHFSIVNTNKLTEENKIGSASISEKNGDKLNQNESNLNSFGRISNDLETKQTIPQIEAIKHGHSETRDVHIQKQQAAKQQHNEQREKRTEVIDLLDDDADTVSISSQSPQVTAVTSGAIGVKRPRPVEINKYSHSMGVVPGSSLQGYQSYNQHQTQSNEYRARSSGAQVMSHNNIIRRPDKSSDPLYIQIPPNHTPTWDHPLPPLIKQSNSHANQHKSFELSLLNVSEFTITGLPVTFDGRPSSVLGFRKIVKEVSRGHGKAVFERDKPNPNNVNGSTNIPFSNTEQNSDYSANENPDGGKWRIPLGAYRAFFSFLKSDRMCTVKGIPEEQLKIASLGKARLEKGFPSVKKILSYGVPNGLATALAPFQRGGVEFVVEKEGRALIADDMGLGKTIQSIASMSVYHEEWPLLILTPSSARYHWATEFLNWLGRESALNKKEGEICTADKATNDVNRLECYEEDEIKTNEPRQSMRLLTESEIHVLVAGKEKVFPSKETRIVICSYGLATSLVESGKLHAGLFRCAIVDESHMLKNIKTKRTNLLVPILHATTRCILLSGTPALARPTELWPQLKILSTERDSWWDDEDDFVRKYVQRSSAIRRAELHTMLTGTVMIRRMKHDILKSLPSKQREKAIVDVMTPVLRQDFHNCMKLLRKGKGVMAKIAKRHAVVDDNYHKNSNPTNVTNEKLESLKVEYNERCKQKLESIRFAVQSAQMDDGEKANLMRTHFNVAKAEIDVWYKERVQELHKSNPGNMKEEELDPKLILNKMYSMTAKAKIPLIAELVGKWLDDPTKGKLCVFAHHIYVLDEISKLVGLSNNQGSRKRFIRIDGSTSPKERQAQIVAFQNDPAIRIAVLGITAAGVAVTLTASSTVWFAELFWTPALMIQAEDRCHRIGQNATVKCLYFVATGTLDVLLWDLLEKKFRDLGEFVEGKEKMKIVVHNVFKSVKELRSTFLRAGDDILDDDLKQNETEPTAEGNDLIKLERDLQEDIVQLAHEEMVMISQGEDEDGTDNKLLGKLASHQHSVQLKPGLGQTEDEAICLSDDEDDNPTEHDETANAKHENKSESPRPGNEDSYYLSKSRVLHKYRFYKQYFEGSSYGIQLLYVCNRLAVANNRFGTLKPAVGDVLVAVNGHRLPFRCQLEHACNYMKYLINKGTVELIFLEDEAFAKHCSSSILEARKSFEANRYQGRNKKPKNAPSTTSSEDVIEILDD